MIYLFHGSDAEKVRTKAFAWVAAARSREPNLAYVRLAREELSDAALQDAAMSGGLFVSRLLVLIDDPYPPTHSIFDEERVDTGCPPPYVGHPVSNQDGLLGEHVDALAASDNAIIILAPKLAAVKAKRLVAKAKVEYKFDLTTQRREAARGFNSALVNALANRSRAQLWLEVNRALRAGDAPEMLHGLLHWKARDIMEKGSRAWSPKESRALSLALIELLQSSRRGGLGLALSLERFSLSI
ncbi:MAG: hypothetical protein WCW36_00505 [Candidatus Paceibacterota bacterium]|jgi:hypothetical protein